MTEQPRNLSFAQDSFSGIDFSFLKCFRYNFKLLETGSFQKCRFAIWNIQFVPTAPIFSNVSKNLL